MPVNMAKMMEDKRRWITPQSDSFMLENVDYDNIPFRRGRKGDIEIDYDGIIMIRENSILLMIEGQEIWVPRSQLAFIDRNTVIINEQIAKKVLS